MRSIIARSNGGRPVLAIGACGAINANRSPPRHDLLHLIEQDLLARALHVEIEAKVFLFHAVNARNLRALGTTTDGEF